MDDFGWIEDVKMVTTLEYPESWSHEKLSRRDARAFKHLTYKHSSHFYEGRDYQSLKKGLEMSLNNEHMTKYREETSEKLEVIRIIEKYKISNEDVARLCYINGKMARDYRNEYNKTPQKEGRDNKGVRVGGGYGGNRNKVRYPSKKRSKRVWKTFYKMFPYYAEKDGWDGKKSSRINFKNKK
jgi:hypothetical protein